MIDEELNDLLAEIDAGGQRKLAGWPEEIKGPDEEIGGGQEIVQEGPENDGGQDETRGGLKEKWVNHKCFAVPFNSTQWEPGTVVDVFATKGRSGNRKYIFGIRLDDGRRIAKMVDSPTVRVLEDEVDLPRRVRKYRKLKLTPTGARLDGEKWSDEDINNELAEVADNIGHLVTFPETGQYGVRVEGGKSVTGRITRIVVNKQQRKLQYRVEVQEGAKLRVYTKTTDTPFLQIAASIDEEGERLQAAYTRRLMKKGALAGTDTYKAYKTCEAMLQEAQRKFKKAGEELERARVNFERAKSLYISTNI